jgi:hypothetical protein
MHDQLMNQDIARLHRADILRQSSRRVAVVGHELPEPRTTESVVARVRGLARHVAWHRPVLRTR